jgi:hypothetical protein
LSFEIPTDLVVDVGVDVGSVRGILVRYFVEDVVVVEGLTIQKLEIVKEEALPVNVITLNLVDLLFQFLQQTVSKCQLHNEVSWPLCPSQTQQEGVFWL